MRSSAKDTFGIGSPLLASNIPADDVITYLGWELCAVSPRGGIGPYIVPLKALDKPRTYHRDDPILLEHAGRTAAALGESAESSATMLPSMFCWTRFGSESGMTVEQIVIRKEMERRATGMFVWGIGNALGVAINELRSRTTQAQVLFSPMTGPAAKHDSTPGAVVAWRSYVSVTGVTTPLPPGVLVVSRAASVSGGAKRYYALFCSTESPIELKPEAEIEIGVLRNLTGTKLIGDQQTTAVVTVDPSGSPRRRYPVSLVANLVAPFYSEMADPIALRDTDVDRMNQVAKTGDVEVWRSTTVEILMGVPQ